MIPASIEGFDALASRNGSAEMDENTRSRRDPGDIDPDDIRNGHGAGDVEARRTSRAESEPEQKSEPKSEPRKEESGGSVRTTRDGSSVRTSSEPESGPRSNTRETGNRTTIPGNTSETGAGSPTPDSTTTRTSPQIPGMPAGGCTRTAGMFLITSVGLATFVSKLLRR